MEAEHFFEKKSSEGVDWKIIPNMGRTLSGVTLMPYTKPVEGSTLSYKGVAGRGKEIKRGSCDCCS